MEIRCHHETWPIEGRFTISRGSKTAVEIVRVCIEQGGFKGQGECVPYAHYGETIKSVMEQILDLANNVKTDLKRHELQKLLPAGAARNAIDCALWDLEAKQNGTSAHHLAGFDTLGRRETFYTLTMASGEKMAQQAKLHCQRSHIKLKVGGQDDHSRIQAVHHAAPEANLIVDANEAWSDHNIIENLQFCAQNNVVLVEQPLPAQNDEILTQISHPVPICADESAHTTEDLRQLISKYDCVNIKLDKTGGLTEALKMQNKVIELGFSNMIGCMIGTSLAMAPAMIVAQRADFVDLDGPLLLTRDRDCGLEYGLNTISPPKPELWG